jgi:hypothetical protein
MGARKKQKGGAKAELTKIPAPVAVPGSAATVQFGIPRPPQQLVLLFSPVEWEEFVREWVYGLKQQYSKVLRMGGGGDMGIDVAGFTDAKLLQGVWDNYQCKYYASPLKPSTAAPEIAKVMWYSFNKEYVPPRKYYFMAPRECGMTLKKLLANPGTLKKYVVDNWDNQCAEAITEEQTIALNDDFAEYVKGFNFSIFDQRTLLEVLDEHRKTPYYAVRFGGGLPNRQNVIAPPFQAAEEGNRYVQQIFEAYSEKTKTNITDLICLKGELELGAHFHRQREFFYQAEALRNFARDSVPTGTFEDLQSEVHAGVADVEAGAHPDGYERMNAVTQAAAGLAMTSNALMSVTKIQDRKGICHQLANEDRLRWKKP